MAITIRSDSDIKSVNNYTKYLNGKNPGNELKFTADTSDMKLYYYVMGENEFKQNEVLSYGVFNGARDYASGRYQFRFDFDKYIKIRNQKPANLEQLVYGKVWGLDGPTTESTKVYLFLDTVDVLKANIQSQALYKTPSGRILDDVGPAGHSAKYKFNVSFVDGVASTPISISESASEGELVSFTIFRNTTINSIHYISYGYTLGSENMQSFQVSAYNQSKTYFVDIPCNQYITSIKIFYTQSGRPQAQISIPVVAATNTYYYINLDGVMATLNCLGRAHNVENVTRNYLTIGGTKHLKDVLIDKQIKQNVGFNLSEDEVFALMKAPYLYKLEGLEFKRYIIDSSTFEGYNGSVYSSKNFELIISEDRQMKRKSNFNLTFFD